MDSVVSRQPRVPESLAFLALGLGLGALLIVASDALYALQRGVSGVAVWLPFGYAYGAGMVASVNPCGVLLLPSLVAYYLGRPEAEEDAGWRRAARAAGLGLAATAGFVLLFAAIGSVFVAGGRALGAYFPAGGLSVGVLLAGLGVYLVLSGRSLGLAAAGRAMGAVRPGRDAVSYFVFGLGYGIASLACTLPVFLVVVGTAITARGLVPALGQFVSYSLGMGTMLVVVLVASALFQAGATRALRRVVPYVHRLAAAFLLGAGIFITYYWLGPGGLGLIG